MQIRSEVRTCSLQDDQACWLHYLQQATGQAQESMAAGSTSQHEQMKSSGSGGKKGGGFFGRSKK